MTADASSAPLDRDLLLAGGFVPRRASGTAAAGMAEAQAGSI